MAAKHQIVTVALLAALLTACGGNNATQPAMPDGTTAPTTAGAATMGDPTADTGAIGGDPGGALPDPTASGTGTTPTASASPASLGNGFVLKGIVTDSIGKPLQGAKISIGAQTTLSNASGTFEIDGIMDSQVQVDVTLEGYQPISAYTVNFTTDAPTADKEFKLAATTDGSSNTGGSGGGTTTTPTGGFTLQSTFNPASFKSVSAMVVDGDIAYVLGIAKSLILWHNTVVELNAETGEQIKRFNKTGLLSYIPKDATGLALVDGQVHVSNGSTTYVFGADGSLIRKSSGGSATATRQVTDDTRHLTYKLSGGSKVDVTSSTGTTTTYALPSATAAMAIGVDTHGDVLVLDGGQAAVLQYTFQP